MNIPFEELFRYAIIGLTLNFLGYLIYLTLTSLWLSPFATITISYPLGVIAGYFVHKRHTFREQKELESSQFIRFVVIYVIGFFLNWLLLFIFHEKLGYHHQLSAIIAIFIIAGFLFILMKFFIFTSVKNKQSKKFISMIPFNKPFLTGKELKYIAQAQANNTLAGDGPFTRLCHQWIEEEVGCSKALLTHSCTAALEMAAILADIQPGDEVIMPSYTFVSTANAFVLRKKCTSICGYSTRYTEHR